MHLHRLTRLKRLSPFECPQNIGVTDPARDSLGTKGIQARYVAERQVELTHHPLIPGQLTQPAMEGLIGEQNLFQAGFGVFLRRDDAASSLICSWLPVCASFSAAKHSSSLR